MDPWLTDEIKGLLFQPCLEISGHIGSRLDNRVRMGDSIDERALTEDFVDLFDSRSTLSPWGRIGSELRDRGIRLHLSVKKSTVEHATGADLGLTISRGVYLANGSSQAEYCTLIQCKRIDNDGRVADFFHKVGSSGRRQAELMLDITASSFYFIFTPPSFVKVYNTIEPIVFAGPTPGCSSPIWNMGYFDFDSTTVPVPLLAGRQKAAAAGILVVPALAVEAQSSGGKGARLDQILPNCVPFWYWFGELLVPGFIGDRRREALEVASNALGSRDLDQIRDREVGVRYAVKVGIGAGG